MRIAQVVPLQVAVPPQTYGGTERVVHNLTEALVKLGHDVTLYASGDSQTSARLVPFIDRAIRFDRSVDVVAYHIAMLGEIYAHASEYDVIHSHLDYLTLPFVETTTTPTVITLHGRLDQPEFQRVLRARPNVGYVSISESQRRDIPDGTTWLATVHHGVDVESFDFYPTPGDYLCFIGRIAPEKRPDRAIEIAKRAGVPLKIAAKVDPKDADYFQAVVEPLLDHPLIEFVGELDEAHKRELMGKALALVLPIDWPEPFGMVFIESLACGTPVLTCPQGSVPELLRDGVTGYIRDTTSQLVASVGKLSRISRAECRAYAKRRFDTRRMALEYVNVYSQVQGRRALFGASEPLPAGGKLAASRPSATRGALIPPAITPDITGDSIERVAFT